MNCFGKSDIGLVRENNEDYFGFAQVGEYNCLAVADGLGGEACGEFASQLAVDSAIELLKKSLPEINDREALKALMNSVFNKTNEIILRDCLKNRERMGMCTTLTLAVVKDRELTIGHIGDTRCYLCHGSAITQLTVDHNQAAELVRMGEITSEEARNHPGRNRLVKVVGENQYLNPDIYSYNIIYGDLIVLCSDGLYSYMSESDMAQAMKNKSSLENICDKLISIAKANISKDNMTVLIGNTSLK